MLHGKEVMNIYCDKNAPVNIDTMIISIINMMKDYEMPREKIEESIDNFLKMVIFDCLFSNTDRHRCNWGMYIYTEPEKGCELYAMYDNENILLCDSFEDIIEELLSLENLEEHVNSGILSKINTPSNAGRKSTFVELLTYLTNSKYKDRVLKIIEQYLNDFKEEDLRELLEEFDDLSDIRKKGMICIYTTRRKEFERIFEFATQSKEKDGVYGLYD